jgi:hypothetical protein
VTEQTPDQAAAALRHDLGQRCEFLASRAEQSKDPMCGGASNVLKVLGWCLKKNDAYGMSAQRQVEECAKLAYAVIARLEAMHLQQQGVGLVAPSGGQVLAVDRSKTP